VRPRKIFRHTSLGHASEYNSIGQSLGLAFSFPT